MTKNQLAKWIVDKFEKEKGYICSKPCAICPQISLLNNPSADVICDGKCVENIRQALIDVEKERYGKNVE